MSVPKKPRTSFFPSSRPMVLAVESTTFSMGLFRLLRRVEVERLLVLRLDVDRDELERLDVLLLLLREELDLLA